GIRGQAQGFLVVLTQGLGMWIGAKVNFALFTSKVAEPGEGLAEGETVMGLWPDFWWFPAGFSLVVLVLFLLLFREKMRVSVEETIDELAETPELGQ
ncbi:MAG: MFS transporter, partial [Verrucomicrobiales bacterium]